MEEKSFSIVNGKSREGIQQLGQSNRLVGGRLDGQSVTLGLVAVAAEGILDATRLRSIEKAQHLVLESPMAFFEDQHVASVGKDNVFLVVRVQLRIEGQEILLLRGKVLLPVNNHGRDRDPSRIQDGQICPLRENVRPLRIRL